MPDPRFPRSFAVALLLMAAAAPAALAQAPAPSTGPFASAGTLSGARLVTVREELGPLTSIAHTADGRLFLVLREGRILILDRGSLLTQPFLDLRGQVNLSDEGGLLSMAFHPNYAVNGYFFVNYTNLDGDTVIARYQVAVNDPNRATPIGSTLLTVHQPFRSHNGGQVQFGPDGYLYTAMGDGGGAFDPSCAAQKPDNLLGKVLRLDVDQNVSIPPYYGIPAGNPFRGPGNPPDEVWSIGFRNPFRFSFDRETGDLWIGDVGQNHREEVNFQPTASRGGENYGWKLMEGTLCSASDACPATTPVCGSTAYTAPVLEYDHDPLCSVTGGVVYRGSRLPQLRGAYLFGDFCTGTVWAAVREGAGFKVYTFADRVPQITAFSEDAAGEVYMASLTGRVFSLTGDQAGAPHDAVGLYDPSGSFFHLKAANTEAATARAVRFGPRRNTWIPLAGDWDGDGKSTPGFWDGATATFRLKNSLQGGASDVILAVDPPSANVRPVAGDWNGDGKDTVGLYDVTTGSFHLKQTLSGRGFDLTIPLGIPGPNRIPLAGDWHGTGTDSVGLYNPATAEFTLLGLAAGDFDPAISKQGLAAEDPPTTVLFGPPGRSSLPVTGDWDGDGKDGIGVYDQGSAVFRLRNVPIAGSPDLQFRFGTRKNNWRPLAGTW